MSMSLQRIVLLSLVLCFVIFAFSSAAPSSSKSSSSSSSASSKSSEESNSGSSGFSWTFYLVAALVVAFFGYLQICQEGVPAFPLKGKRVVVTGGSTGLGFELARDLLSAGSSVCLIARDPKKLANAVSELRKAFPAGNISSAAADICDRAAISAAIESAVASLGGLDALVCNAGVSHPGRFLELGVEPFEQQIRTNYLGHIYTLKAAVPAIIRSTSSSPSGGRIILVSSMAGLTGVAGFSAYSPAKFAQRGLAETLAMELRPYKIGVSLCCPPDMDTPGYEEENKIKPKECLLISAGTGVFKASEVSKSIMATFAKYQFLIVTGMDGVLLSILCAGTAPASSILQSLLESLAGIIRIVSLAYRKSYNGIVEQVYKENLALKGTATASTGKKDK